MEIIQQLGSLPIFILMFVVIYFLMIRPQSLQRKKHFQMLQDLKKGDRVISRGGLIGRIVDFKGKDKDLIILDVDSNCKVTILKSYIVSLSEK